MRHPVLAGSIPSRWTTVCLLSRVNFGRVKWLSRWEHAPTLRTRIYDRQPSESQKCTQPAHQVACQNLLTKVKVCVSSAALILARAPWPKSGVKAQNNYMKTYQGALEAWDQLCCSFHAEAAVRQPAFWSQNSRKWLLADQNFTFSVNNVNLYNNGHTKNTDNKTQKN